MTIKAPSRYGFIDAVRGIAACVVMLQHSLYKSGLLGGIPPAHLTGFIPTFLELGETGVVAFFLVSGFVIPLSLEKTNDFKLFWLHRVLRILPLYVVIYIVTLIINGGGTLNSTGAFLVNAVSHLLFIQEYIHQENFVGGSWTLSLELVWYIGISALFLIGLNRKTILVVGLTVAASIIAQIISLMGHDVPMGRLSMLVCCVLGLVCYRRHKEEISTMHFGVTAGILALTILANLIIGFAFNRNETNGVLMVVDSWLLGGLVFFVPFFTRGYNLWNHKAFAFLGRISYSIYLVHAVVLLLIERTDVHGFLLLAIVFGSTLAIATLTYRFVEAPPIRFGHRFSPRRNGAPDQITEDSKKPAKG